MVRNYAITTDMVVNALGLLKEGDWFISSDTVAEGESSQLYYVGAQKGQVRRAYPGIGGSGTAEWERWDPRMLVRKIRGAASI